MTNRIRFSLITVSSFLLAYIVLGGLLGRSDSSSEKAYRDLGVYSEVLTRIKQDYVTEPNLKKVTDGAIRGLIEALDPYSTYLSPQEYQDYLAHPDPGPATVGLFVSKRMGFATVVSVLPGGPAEKAGVKPGDLIDRIENTGTRELSVVQIQRLLAGAPESTVTLAVVREAPDKPQKITITRAILTYPPPVAKLVDDGTGYIRVATFNKGKAGEIGAKLKELTSEGASKIVLDLRNCAGGEVEEAENTVDLFMDKGLITYVQGQRYPREDVNAKPVGALCRLPLAVLINQSTAGPAEIVASALLGNKRAEVVGTRSFGVGVVQKMIQVGDGSALLLSVAKYYGPDGKAIHDNGVTPSVVQAAGTDENADDQGETEEPEHFGGKDDQQLQKAIEVLKSAPPKPA
ncbi:MAG TPA: S41 family peptidase [Terriglobia bacterium]|jgi:carboxyl-terminal processing protease|nr:S41 family peptidase [Terriglobia bacterium]